MPVFQRYTQNAPPKSRLWQDRSGVTHRDDCDIGVEKGLESDIVVEGARVSYIASMWCIGAGVLT